MAYIGFIGIGRMGLPMALNLAKGGMNVKAFDINLAARKVAMDAGLNVVETAHEAIHDCDYIISMLPDSEAVVQTYLGTGRVLTSVHQNSVIIDCSTIAPQIARKLAAKAAELRIRMLDAPVSGDPKAAADGTLTFMVGAPINSYNASQSVLELMGINIIHAGEPGLGQMANVCNNMLLAILMTGTAEVMQLGVANGLEARKLADIMRVSSGGNWVLNACNPYPGVNAEASASNGYTGGLTVNLMLKDLALGVHAARNAKSIIPMVSRVQELYQALQKADPNLAQLDFSVIQSLYNPDVLSS